MTTQKRKADAAPPTDSRDESPHKRARLASTVDTISMQNGNVHSIKESADNSTEHSIQAAKDPSRSHTPPSKEDEAVPRPDLPQTWDQASTSDKKLVELKMINAKYSWAYIEQLWEQSMGEKPVKGVLQSRYQHLKDIMPGSKSKRGRKAKSQHVEEPLETSIDNSMAPVSQIAHEQDLPQSWEQANAGDQLIVRMKAGKKAWTRIEEAWQKLTGENPAEGAVQDRYRRIKESVIFPESKGADTKTYTAKVCPQAISQRAKTTLRTPRKRKAKDECSEESLDESSDESSVQSLDATSKHKTTTARRQPRGTVKERVESNAFDGPSDVPMVKRKRLSATEPSDGMREAAESDDLDELSKPSPAAARSAKRSRTQHAVAASAQNTAETPDEMLVEMKERGCSWIEISQAWTERTGLTHAPDTLRRRYPRIKQGIASKVLSKTSASSKRKVNAASPDEDTPESSMRRGKSTAEAPHIAATPIKRNMDRGKRKRSVKYTDSTTDEDELFSAPIEPTTTAPTPAKRRAGRAAKVDRSDPEWLVTNEKSPLAHENLHAEFSNPKTYENFTKSDWEDLRETLPPNVPVNPDGYSIPITFFKYDPDFRRGIREFQEDLGSGRLDPKWQADAAQAMEERARGEFDAYKERKFEEFWGQKQKVDHNALAGESTKIKLELLIQNELFKIGDYFSYSRVVGGRQNGVLIEKDCKIVKLDGKALTFAIPPGQRKYSRHLFEPGFSGDAMTETKEVMVRGDEDPLMYGDHKPGTVQPAADTTNNGNEASGANGIHDEALNTDKVPEHRNTIGGIKAQIAEVAPDNKLDESRSTEAENSEVTALEATSKRLENETHESTPSKESEPNGATNGVLQEEKDEDILHSISNLSQLEDKIVDIDGRFNPKDLTAQNAWKNFRAIRNHQDLGSLFEMREDFYVYKHPRIVKEPKRKR